MIYIFLCFALLGFIAILRLSDRLLCKLYSKIFNGWVGYLGASVTVFIFFVLLGVKWWFMLSLYYCSVCFGPVLAGLLKMGDISKMGSGNVGATNMLRVGGIRLGALTLLLDGTKGLVLILFLDRIFHLDFIGCMIETMRISDIISFLQERFSLLYGFEGAVMTYEPAKKEWFLGLMGIACHIIPVFSRSTGGKGVAVFYGLLIMLETKVVIVIVFAVWLIAFALWHISSVCSLLSTSIFFILKLMNVLLMQTKLYIDIGGSSLFRIELHALSASVILLPIFISVSMIFIAHKKNIYKLIIGEERRFFIKD